MAAARIGLEDARLELREQVGAGLSILRAASRPFLDVRRAVSRNPRRFGPWWYA